MIGLVALVVLALAAVWNLHRYRQAAATARLMVAESAQCRLWAQAIGQWQGPLQPAGEPTRLPAPPLTPAAMNDAITQAAQVAGLDVNTQLQRIEPQPPRGSAGSAQLVGEVVVTLANVTMQQWATFLSSLHTHTNAQLPALDLSGGSTGRVGPHPPPAATPWDSVKIVMQYPLAPPVEAHRPLTTGANP
jgi:hypothetical protein